jgi:hypothetical protein
MGFHKGNKLFNMKTGLVLLILVVLNNIYCGYSATEPEVGVSFDMCKSAFQVLKEKRIYFAHMSVGYNIINGIEEVLRENNIDFPVREIVKDSITMPEPGLYHSSIGRNGDPQLKMKSFKKICTNDLIEQKADIAMMKFCYADITKSTNIDTIFEEYLRTVEQIKAANPRITLVHSTVPLMAYQSNMKERLRNLLIGDKGNVNRNLLNRKILEYFAGKDPVFDLAAIEASTASEKKCTFKYKGSAYLCMNPLYTNDGGHLNKRARKMIGCEFMSFLADVIRKR